MADTTLTPVERQAQAMEIKEKGCRVCQKRIEINGDVRCRVGKRFPKCRNQKNGFRLEVI